MYGSHMDASKARTLNIRSLVAKAGGPGAFANAYGTPRDGHGSIWPQAQVSQWISLTKPKGIGHKLAREIERRIGVVEGSLDTAPEPDAELPRAPIRVAAFTIRGIDDEDGLDPATDVMLNVLDVEVSGGNPDGGPPVFDFLPTRYQLPYQHSWLHQHGATPDDILVMPVRGHSMNGVVWHGDPAVIHRKRVRIRNNHTYAFVDSGGPRIKKLSILPDGRLRVRSKNKDKVRYPDEFLSREEQDRILILGEVFDRSGPGGLGPNDDDEED